jgi:hypothetical protein
VTIVVAREPQWQAEAQIESTEDAGEQAVSVPADARLVMTTTDTSPEGGGGGKVDVLWLGDETGATRLRAGEAAVLVDAADHDRNLVLRVDVKGAVHWRLAVETRR